MQSITAVLYTYETILLRTFITITQTGEYSRLVIFGSATIERLAEAWESIVRANSKENGDRNYDSYFQLFKSYTQLVASYTVIKASLLNLCYVIDYELVSDLRKRGYKIDLANSISFARSIEAALCKVSNLVTKAVMKKKEMESMVLTTSQVRAPGFEEIMANLNTGLGFEVKDDLTLSRYNEYKKILKSKVDNLRKQNVRN